MNVLTIQHVRRHFTPPGHITLWWLGQAGFLAQSPGGRVVALDPDLTNSCKAIGEENGLDFDRQVPPPMRAGELSEVDAILYTHSHQDHCDPETLAAARRAGGQGLYIAPPESVQKLTAWGVPSGDPSLCTSSQRWSSKWTRRRTACASCAASLPDNPSPRGSSGPRVRDED